MRMGTGKHIRISGVLEHLPSLSLFQRLSWQNFSSLYICSSSAPSSLAHILHSLQPEFWLAWLIPTTLFAACLMGGCPVSDWATLVVTYYDLISGHSHQTDCFSLATLKEERWAMAPETKWNNKWNRNIIIHSRVLLTVLLHVKNKLVGVCYVPN